MLYAWNENFILPFSHDEVVHGNSMVADPGDAWQKLATLRPLRILCAHRQEAAVHGHEFGQRHEWNHDASLDWHLLDHPQHAGCSTSSRI
jgi:1,4-alpha-glucan branching enzyme